MTGGARSPNMSVSSRDAAVATWNREHSCCEARWATRGKIDSNRPLGVWSQDSMYAIIQDGAHQYRVEEGQVLEVQRKDLAEGAETVEFDQVLLVGDVEDGPKIGQPLIEGAKVTASVVGEVKGDKVVIHKLRRRKNYGLKKGHRQKFLRVKVDKITV